MWCRQTQSQFIVVLMKCGPNYCQMLLLFRRVQNHTHFKRNAQYKNLRHPKQTFLCLGYSGESTYDLYVRYSSFVPWNLTLCRKSLTHPNFPLHHLLLVLFPCQDICIKDTMKILNVWMSRFEFLYSFSIYAVSMFYL